MDSMMIGIVVVAGVVGFIIILALFVTNYIKAEPHEAIILTGRKHKTIIEDEHGRRVIRRGWRSIVGGATLKIPVIEKINRITLELMNLSDVKVVNCLLYTSDAADE